MRNVVQYSKTRTVKQSSILSGGWNIGVNSNANDLSGFYNGITPVNGGYTIYIKKNGKGPSIYSPKNDSELIDIVEHLSGNIYSVTDAINWVLGQVTMTIGNHNYSNIVTDGLVLNLDAGFVSSYPRNGTSWYDLSGNGYDGDLINGPTFNSNGYLEFDGTDDYVTLGSSASSLVQGKTEISMGLFFKLDTLGTLRGLLGTLNYGCNRNLGLTANNTQITFYNDNTSCYSVGVGGVETGKWMYAVGTYDGTTTKVYLYKDNTLSQSAGTGKSGPTNTFSSEFRVMGPNHSYRTNGQCAFAFVYDKVLSEDEVLQNYYAGLQRLVTTEGLVLSLNPQNTNLYAPQASQARVSPIANDISGNDNNGTLLNNVTITSESGGSWDFDGSDDVIKIPFNSGSMDFSGGQTICIWLRPHTGAPLSRRNPYNQAYGGSGTITHEKSGGFSYYFGTNGGNGQPYVGRGSSFTVVENELSFITVTRNQTTNVTNWYKNGTLTNTSNAGGYATTTNGNSNITIGDGYAGNFVGDIFDVKVYNRGLTDEEVLIIYESTKLKYE